MTATEKKNEQSFEYKRTRKEQVGDFFYETSRKLFWKNGKHPTTNMGIKRGNQIFIFAMLILPIISWGVFWLYTNIQSIFMAFEHPVTGELIDPISGLPAEISRSYEGEIDEEDEDNGE